MYMLLREGMINQEILLALGCTKATQISKTQILFGEKDFLLYFFAEQTLITFVVCLMCDPI